MSFWDWISFNKLNEEKITKAAAEGKPISLSSSEQIELYLKYRIKDAEFAKIFFQIFEKSGCNATIEIKKGGDGNPYQIEYVVPEPQEKLTKKEKKERIKAIIKYMEDNNSLSENERHKLQDELAQLSDSHTIIWVNAKTQEEFDEKEQLFVDTISAVKQIFNK